MTRGLKQPAKGFKLARGTTLQKANTAKKEGVKFRLLSVFETKTLFVVGNGSCHKNLNDDCMSVISLVDGDQTQTQADRIQLRVSCLCRQNSEKAKHKAWETLEPGNTVCSPHPGPQQGEQTKDAGRQMLNIHKEGQWWKMRQLGRMRRLNRRKQDEGSESKSKTQATKNKSGNEIFKNGENADARMN